MIKGYTSIGSIHDTVPNDLLSIRESTSSEGKFRPAYLLADGRLERAGRVRKFSSPVCGELSSACNGLKSGETNRISMPHKFLMCSTFMSTSKCMEAFRSVRCPSPNEASDYFFYLFAHTYRNHGRLHTVSRYCCDLAKVTLPCQG